MNQRTMRFTGSPTEALDVEVVCWEAGGLGGATDVGGPRLGAADVHVALGEVGHPVGEGGQVVGGADPGAEPRAGRAPVPGQQHQGQGARRCPGSSPRCRPRSPARVSSSRWNSGRSVNRYSSTASSGAYSIDSASARSGVTPTPAPMNATLRRVRARADSRPYGPSTSTRV